MMTIQYFNALASTVFLLTAAVALAGLACALFRGMLRSQVEERMLRFLFESPKPDEEKGKPSISRLQMLIWNFVVAFAFLYVLAKWDGSSGEALMQSLGALFSQPVLILLGISNATYVVGKMTPQAGAGSQAPTAAQAGKPGDIPKNLSSTPTQPTTPTPAG
ncbi:MAG: hypothetical protein ACI9DC_001815 [Gammaproteobacteria bacterium]|jgi:hypothetical protein